jgi:hypothetical protein
MGKQQENKLRSLISKIRKRNRLGVDMNEEMIRLRKEIDDHFEATKRKVDPDSEKNK